MKTFNIQEAERLSAVKAHTIRTWEKRYKILAPLRTKANIRNYSAGQLRKIITLGFLNKNGFRISALAKLSEEELESILTNMRPDERCAERTVCQLIIAMYELKVDAFENLLNESLLTWPSEAVVSQIIYPFLHRVGLLYKVRRTVTAEHLAATIIRRKLFWSIERLDGTGLKKKTVLLFLLPGEQQLDLLLLFLYHELEAAGYRVVYLGLNVTMKNLEETSAALPVDYYVTYQPRTALQPLVEPLERLAPKGKEKKLLLVRRENFRHYPDNWQGVRVLQAEELLPFLASEKEEAA